VASCENIGKYFSGISGAGITMRYNNVCSELAGNKKLKHKEKRTRSRIKIWNNVTQELNTLREKQQILLGLQKGCREAKMQENGE